MDDVDGYPTIRGRRVSHAAEEAWVVVFTPDGLEMQGPDRVVTVPLSAVHAIRQRPDVATDGLDATRFEVEWVTSLGEDRLLALRSEDAASVERMCRIAQAALEELDDNSRPRFVDWPLAVLVLMGLIYATRGVVRAPAPLTAYDWSATIFQFLVDALVVPALYVLLRALVRAVREWRNPSPA
jgi:hypothetical protein